jgi:hypothetical protein
MIQSLSTKGLIALHLEYGAVPFQEQYFPALQRWLERHDIRLTDYNYIPFYFVYSLLLGPLRRKLLQHKRVLLVNGATNGKKARIIESVRSEGASEVLWCSISQDRSFHDRLELGPFLGKVDLAIIGAGVGKPSILLQMEPLSVPSIDGGYVFEVWADSAAREFRPFCVPDEDITS